jgi:hypothetical protein
MGRTDRPWDATDTDRADTSEDTEGHDSRLQYPVPPNVNSGDNAGGLGRRGKVAESDEPDTEGHLQFRRRPGEGGE